MSSTSKSVAGKTQPPELLVLAHKHGASTRIQNALEHAYRYGRLRIRTVDEYLAASAVGAPKEFLVLPGFGRNSVRQLDELIRSSPRDRIDHVLLHPAPKTAPTEREPAAIIPGRPRNSDVRYPGLDDVLTPREVSIIARRFGLGSANASTLEAIAIDHRCTRERIRQIESKAIKTLRRTRNLEFLGHLAIEAGRIREMFWEKRYWLRPKEVQARASALKAEDQLAIAIAYGSVTDWLSKSAVRVSGGWLRPDVPMSDLRDVRARLERYEKVRTLPMPLYEASVELHCDERTLGAAVDMSRTSRMYEDFICPTIVGARTRRALMLVRVLSAHGRGLALSQSRLADYLRISIGPVAPQWRDLQIVLAEHKHLFVNLYEEGWATCAPVPIGAPSVLPPPSGPTRSRVELESDDEQGKAGIERTVRNYLTNQLMQYGPMQLNEIRDRFDRSGITEFAKSSIGPTLLTYEEFIRLAPGVYALCEDWTNGRISRERLDRVLLSERQCELYCQARWAGEPGNLYPSWTENAELSWARWASRNDNKRLLESLLSVADVSSWPAGQAERRTWLERLKRGVQYSLAESLRVPLDETVPTFEDVLAAGLWARQQGHVSWMSANRVTGKRVNDRHAASILALLVVFGITRSAEHWQGKHMLANDLQDQLDKMLDHAFVEGGGWPKQLIALAGDSAIHQRYLGWIQEQDMDSLLQKVGGAEGVDRGIDRKPSGDQSDILAEMKQRARRARLDELVDR